MESKPVEFRHSPACCKSQNACPANWLAFAEMGVKIILKSPALRGRGFL